MLPSKVLDALKSCKEIEIVDSSHLQVWISKGKKQLFISQDDGVNYELSLLGKGVVFTSKKIEEIVEKI